LLLQLRQEFLGDPFRVVAQMIRIAQRELLALAEGGVLEVQDLGDPGIGEPCLLTLSSSRNLSLLAVGKHRRAHADHLLDLRVELPVLPDRLDQSEEGVSDFVGKRCVIDLGYELHGRPSSPRVFAAEGRVVKYGELLRPVSKGARSSPPSADAEVVTGILLPVDGGSSSAARATSLG
jgi:hypothetical protein